MSKYQGMSFDEATKELWALKDTYQWLYHDAAKNLFEDYEKQYDTAEDRDDSELKEKDAFSSFTLSAQGVPLSKEEVIDSFKERLTNDFVTRYIQRFSREDMIALRDLLLRGTVYNLGLSITLVYDVTISIDELITAWNKNHPDDEKIYPPEPAIDQ